MFLNPNALVYVHRGGLIVIGKHNTQDRLTFQDGLTANLEIIDTRAFTRFCQEFFTAHALRHTRVLIVLDYSIVFEKNIELDKSGEPEALKEAFVSAIPLEPEQRAVLAVRTSEQLRLFAANVDIYQCVTEALTAADVSKVVAAVPAAMYSLAGPKQPLRALADTLLKDASVRKIADFTTL